MSNDKDIGTLLTNVEWIKKEMILVRKDVESLKRLKWQLIGGALTVSAFVSLMVAITFGH